MRRAAVLVLIVAASCGGSDAPELERGTAVIETGGPAVRVSVEIADTSKERLRGLMGRRSLAPDAGMIFFFEGNREDGFWMKDTLIPLSIAFVDGSGRVVRILDMAPCRADPCPIYDPGVSYRSALEVNRGSFRRWGVSVGDSISLE